MTDCLKYKKYFLKKQSFYDHHLMMAIHTNKIDNNIDINCEINISNYNIMFRTNNYCSLIHEIDTFLKSNNIKINYQLKTSDVKFEIENINVLLSKEEYILFYMKFLGNKDIKFLDEQYDN